MSGSLVNAFGAIALDRTSRDITSVLEDILVELRILNVHMSQMSGEEVTTNDVTS